MKHKRERKNPNQARENLAGLSARIMAEEGVNDFGSAKRKAAHRLGLENPDLPGDAEIETALRAQQNLFYTGDQQTIMNDLLRNAAEIMAILQPFSPYLSGSLLEGLATPYTEIDLQIFADSSKDIEIFLLNQKIDFEHRTPRNARAEAVLTVFRNDCAINLVIYPVREERIAFKNADGRPRARARLPEVQRLLASSNQILRNSV